MELGQYGSGLELEASGRSRVPSWSHPVRTEPMSSRATRLPSQVTAIRRSLAGLPTKAALELLGHGRVSEESGASKDLSWLAPTLSVQLVRGPPSRYPLTAIPRSSDGTKDITRRTPVWAFGLHGFGRRLP